jgi:anti-sigma factor RsiW
MTGDDPGSAHLGDLLSALVDGEMAGSHRQVAEDHLAGCPACRDELAATFRAQALVAGLPMLEPPSALWPGARTGTRRRGGPFVWVGAAAAAAALTLLAASPPQHHVTPQMAHLVQDHATSSGNDPVTQLAPAVVQASFRK